MSWMRSSNGLLLMRHFHKLTHSACAPLQQAAVDMVNFAAAAGTPLIRFTDQDADVHPAFE